VAENKEFIITRLFNAPRDMVYKAWTDPKHFSCWYGPKGGVVTKAEFDIRPGGISYLSMQIPNGPILALKWMYEEVVPSQRLVWLGHCIDEKGEMTRHFIPLWPMKIRTRVDFEEKGNGTQVTFRWIPVNAQPEEMEAFVKGFEGATAGWNGSFEKLDAYLVVLQGSVA
jgi:uncharacterized protein YndB with AHSA1/START domain